MSSSRLLSSVVTAAVEARAPLLSATRRVDTFGAGIYGEIGRGDYSPSIEPIALDPTCFNGADPIAVGCGWANSWALTNQGRAYLWGWQHDHRTSTSCLMTYRRTPNLLRRMQRTTLLGTLGFRSGHTTPKIIEGVNDIVQVSCGAGWSGFVTADGRVFTVGDGMHGQLGHGSAKTNLHEPLEIRHAAFDECGGVKQISCGFSHTLIVANDGQVYSCGRLDCYAIGIGAPDDHFGDVLEICTRPQSLSRWYERMDRTGAPSMGTVRKVATGRNISMFLTEEGQVWTCGMNGGGALGTPGFQHRPFPVQISDPFEGERVTDIACGHYHMIALTESGRVFTWGIGNHGSCGRSPRLGYLNPDSKANRWQNSNMAVYTLRPEALPTEIVGRAVFAGAHHSAIITADDCCLVLGGDVADADAYLPKMPFGCDEVFSVGFGLVHGVVVRRPRSLSELATPSPYILQFLQREPTSFRHFLIK